ncbi:PAS domain-containing protein [Sorangium sp. So ce1151]|uniref:PAS domain-containing protein n=1 Tax=Sorangium sp. So ce1151 TaxID=3133332 RepID=UPI003F60C57D
MGSAETTYDRTRPDNDDEGPLSEEVVTLRRRVVELEQQLPETHRSGAAQAAACAPAGRELVDVLSLRPAEQAALLDALPAMIFFKDREHRYLLVNKAYADHHRVPAEKIVGRRDEEIFVAETARTYHESDEAVMASGEPSRNVELHWRLEDGSRRSQGRSCTSAPTSSGSSCSRTSGPACATRSRGGAAARATT